MTYDIDDHRVGLAHAIRSAIEKYGEPMGANDLSHALGLPAVRIRNSCFNQAYSGTLIKAGNGGRQTFTVAPGAGVLMTPEQDAAMGRALEIVRRMKAIEERKSKTDAKGAESTRRLRQQEVREQGRAKKNSAHLSALARRANSRPAPRKPIAWQGEAETLAQFKKRGGKIERLERGVMAATERLY